MRCLPLILPLALVASAASAQTPEAQAPQERLLAALQANRLPITMSEGRPSGSGWDLLVREAKAARFTLIGEEHGVAETAQLSAALFTAAHQAGYNKFAIELSPIIAQDVEAAGRRNGVAGICAFLTAPDMFSFSNLREETQFIADVIAATPGNQHVLAGFDREVFNQKYLTSKLQGRVTPQERALITRTIDASRAINTAPNSYAYTQLRTDWNRENMAALLQVEQARKTPSRVMMKFGYNHMIRGANYVNAFDLGAMADEVAALTRDHAFHIIVLPSPGSMQAVLGAKGYEPTSTGEFDEFKAGDQRLTKVLSNANATDHEVIDLRPLRQFVMRGLDAWNPDLVKTINGYDVAVIWKGAHASTPLK